MTRREKYRKAIEALREIADRSRGQYDYASEPAEFLEGYAAGRDSAAYLAEDALKTLGEKVKSD